MLADDGSNLADAVLWDAFSRARLPHAGWTHRAHLRVAFMHMRSYSLDEAHISMRVGIIKLNASHGVIESVSRGYHETLTRVWLVLVGEAIGLTPSIGDSSEFVDVHACRLGKDAPLVFYSRERLFSPTARARFIEPDLAKGPF